MRLKAYVDVVPSKAGFIGMVVDEQDYHEGGPFAHSYQTARMSDSSKAKDAAREWAEEKGYSLVAPDEI